VTCASVRQAKEAGKLSVAHISEGSHRWRFHDVGDVIELIPENKDFSV
jgi:hypothetical protein